MLNENAKAWVAALRSGEYEQGRRSLRTQDNGFCCLGVACDLYGKAHDTEWTAYEEAQDEYKEWRFLGATGGLPGEVATWLGLMDSLGVFRVEGGKTESLADQNDNGMTFTEIADVIESEPLSLFGAMEHWA